MFTQNKISHQVHVWRFVTRGTVEEELTKKHQEELFKLSEEQLENKKRILAAARATEKKMNAEERKRAREAGDKKKSLGG